MKLGQTRRRGIIHGLPFGHVRMCYLRVGNDHLFSLRSLFKVIIHPFLFHPPGNKIQMALPVLADVLPLGIVFLQFEFKIE